MKDRHLVRPGLAVATVWLAIGLLLISLLSGCASLGQPATAAELAQRQIRVVATTSLLADVVRQVGGERVEVTALMGSGVDPHLYKAREGDVLRLTGADLIVYHGLHLESKMADVLAGMDRWVPTAALAEVIPSDQLIYPTEYEGYPDPHIWFDVSLWMEVVEHTASVLAERDPAHEATYRANADQHLRQLEDLDAYVRTQAARLPREQRVLITAHDAFSYFARAYGFEVRGLQGISTVSEASIADVQGLADFIAQRRIRAIFVESSVPVRNVEAVREAVLARGGTVEIGGELFSDSLGEPGTSEGTYVGMVRHNIDTIVEALSGLGASR